MYASTWKSAFLNDFSGVVTSFSQFGHLTKQNPQCWKHLFFNCLKNICDCASAITANMRFFFGSKSCFLQFYHVANSIFSLEKNEPFEEK